MKQHITNHNDLNLSRQARFTIDHIHYGPQGMLADYPEGGGLDVWYDTARKMVYVNFTDDVYHFSGHDERWDSNGGFGLQFQYFAGDFLLHDSRLGSLEGCPFHVHGQFDVSRITNLSSLKGGPRIVDGDFSAEGCALTSLKGGPVLVGESYNVGANRLTDLLGAPSSIPGTFFASGNDLRWLLGGPEYVGRSYFARNNRLRSLEGMAKEVGGRIVVEGNPDLDEARILRFIPKDFDRSKIAADMDLRSVKFFQDYAP